MNRFEQLIEYVINDEEQKARELFHDIVVAKSREIYESMMAEEAEEIEEDAEDLEEDAEDLEEAEEIEEDLDEADPMDEVETEEISMEGEDDADLGGDSSDEFIDNVEAGGDEDGDEDGGDEAATKDDIMNLEDKLDQLMAEFEAAMGGDDMGMGDGDGFGPEEGGDAIEMDDTGEMEPGMMEAISLKAAPKPVTTEQGNGHYGKPGPAPKPKMGAGSEGQNNKSPLPSGRKG